MLIGHIGIGLIAKRVEPKISVGTLVLAALLADLLWCIFMLAGLEEVLVMPGRGAVNYYQAVDVALSHSLVMNAVWGVLFAAGYFLRRRYLRGAWVLLAVVVSHWVLDVVAHKPDMPLAPGLDALLGLGLWTSVPATVIVEGGLWVLAIVLYARATRPRNRAGVFAYWGGVALLVVPWYNNIAGPGPPSPAAMAVGSLVFFSLIVAWAYWVNRLRPARLDRVDHLEREPSPFVAPECGNHMTVKPLLRQFGDLTSADFVSHPVWIGCHTVDYDEPWYDDTDEETFRPWTEALPVGPEVGMLLVRAQLVLADGRSFDGFITPQHDGEPLHLGTIQPQLFLPSGSRADFWDGMFKGADNRRTSVYSELGSDPGSIFPIKFRADKGLATGQVAGEIPGFCWCPDDTVHVYV